METHVMNFIETDVAGDLTLIEWKRTRLDATPRRRRIRFTPPRIRPAFAI